MDQYYKLRLEKLETLAKKRNPYPNDFKPQNLALELAQKFKDQETQELEKLKEKFSLAGRIMANRSFGKAGFLKLQDRSGSLQIYIGKQFLTGEDFEETKLLDIGDIIGVQGSIFRTHKGELSLKAESFKILVKTLHTLPEKFHGLTDIERRYRERYVDLIMNPEVKEKFKVRAHMVSYIRKFFTERDFMEVETPMMQPLCGGATAKPFTTHHNALNMKLYLRVAPELYLKRLVVGGLERVFELNRNFRNEGLSAKHNPEFTMLEFYQSYATYEDLMKLTEELLSNLVKHLFNSHEVTFEERKISFKTPFEKMTVKEAIHKYVGLSEKDLNDEKKLQEFLTQKKIHSSVESPHIGDLLMDIFDTQVEEKLVQPTFITQYPLSVSPLSRRNDSNPEFVDRFELYICQREIVNAFSELNDPLDQKKRFEEQVEQNREGAQIDEDYVRALEYGLPPTGGEGIGIDRLAMILTDSHNIRDVILFPHLRHEP
ncbi:MAG: lysine--tRNA ligase [Deltaproteobacteria bacterium]|nr:lysine--tRNA ligase [Deltaproteobacteria bacterium]